MVAPRKGREVIDMPQLEETIGDTIRSIALENDEAKRTQIVKILMQSKLKASFNEGSETLLRTYLFKALQALKVNDWVVNKTTQSGISVSDASNIKDALVALMLHHHNGGTMEDLITQCVSEICQFASTEEATTTSTTFSFGAEEANDDLALLGLATAEVTEDAGHLLTDFAAQKTEVFTTDLDAAVKIVMTPDSNGMIHGNFGSTNMQSKEVARQLQAMAKFKITEPKDIQQFVLASIGIEALQLAPRRQLSGTTDTVGFASKHGPMSKVDMNMAVLTRIGGYLVNKVGIYNHRFAKYVSTSFHDDVMSFMELDYDAVINPPNLTSKDGWSWPYTVYTPKKRGFTTEDLLNL